MKSNAPQAFTGASDFLWRDKRIRQDEGVFKIGTDALLLGGWIPRVVSHASRILDAGTGTGILAIMLQSAFPDARIDAIDASPAAVQLAGYNFEHAATGGLISARLEDVTRDRPDSEPVFDLIVSNPPYFTTGHSSADTERAAARHLDKGIPSWVQGLCARIRENGHIGIIVPFADAFAWTTAFNAMGYYVRHRAEVKTYQTDACPVRTLLHVTQQLHSPRIMHLAIREKGGAYTREYLDLTGLRTTEK